MNDLHEGMSAKGLMGGSFRDTGHGYPGGSRDFWMIELICSAMDCICNTNGKCSVPSRSIIGPGGKCKGYQKDK